MTRKACSIFQYNDQWYGISLIVGPKGIEDVEYFPESSLEVLDDVLRGSACGVSLESSAGYVAGLKFPFGGKRRIGLVIRDELEEYFPFPIEEMAIDFQEWGKGNVLVAAAAKKDVDGAAEGRRVRTVSLNSLSALYAVRRFVLTGSGDFMLLHVEAKRAVMIACKDEKLHSVREIFYSGNVQSIREVADEYLRDGDFMPSVILVTGEAEACAAVREVLAGATAVPVESPTMRGLLRKEGIPDFALIGIGSALMALGGQGEINLINPGREGIAEIERGAVYACGGVLGLALILFGLSYFNLITKERIYRNLGKEETLLYKSAFPKSPPVKDIERAFEEKVKALEKDQTAPGPAVVSSSPLAVLAELSSKIDSGIDVKLNEYINDGDEFTISGTTVSFASVEKIRSLVEKARGVRSAEIQNVDLAGNRQVKFKIRGRM